PSARFTNIARPPSSWSPTNYSYNLPFFAPLNDCFRLFSNFLRQCLRRNHPRMPSPTKNPGHNLLKARQLQPQLDLVISQLLDLLRLVPLPLPNDLCSASIEPYPDRNRLAPREHPKTPHEKSINREILWPLKPLCSYCQPGHPRWHKFPDILAQIIVP